MEIFQIFIPLELFELSKYHPYCSINGHKWTFVKISSHWNLLNYQNITRTGRNWVSFMYKGIYFIYIIPFGEQQPWMSEVPKTFQQKKQVPPKWSIFFLYCIKNMSFWGSPKGAPHDRCRRTMKKKYVAMNTNGIGWCSWKNGWICSLGTYILCMQFCKEFGPFHV